VNVLAGQRDDLRRYGSHRLVCAKNQCITRHDIVRPVLTHDAQHVAPQGETAICGDRIPRGLVEEINAVGKREMKTARAMAFLVTFAPITDAGDRFAQGD
jgi:hypothetical protein